MVRLGMNEGSLTEDLRRDCVREWSMLSPALDRARVSSLEMILMLSRKPWVSSGRKWRRLVLTLSSAIHLEGVGIHGCRTSRTRQLRKELGSCGIETPRWQPWVPGVLQVLRQWLTGGLYAPRRTYRIRILARP